MLASHEWLRGFVPHGKSARELHDLLSAHVATVDAMAALRHDLAPIVIARVVEAAKHPDSDHLSITKVDAGTGTLLDVVCGAPNVTAGVLYPFAPTGTTMPNGLKIEKRKIRGHTSNGMLCSARELGLGEDHEGILALDLDVPVGTPFLAAMPVGDVQLDIDVLPNRPDLLSQHGLAREISALTGVPLGLPPELATLVPPTTTVVAAPTGSVDGVTLRITDEADAPRVAAAVIRGVTVGPSPQWLVDRLASVGARSINNVVDVTNYCLHAFGQPMHAYDLGTLRGGTLLVRRGASGESVITLDGVTRAVSPEMLVIADAERVVGVAGVMGGRDTEVTATTTDVVLEVASFEPGVVRRTRRALGLSTDASHRFERGTDPAAPAALVGLAAALIAQVAGGAVSGAGQVGTPVLPRPAVAVRASRVTRLLGAPIDRDGLAALLAPIGFGCAVHDADTLLVTPPSWRHDVHRDVDLIEEVARLRGYEALPDTLVPFRPGTVPDHPLHVTGRRLRDLLVGRGLMEVRPLPFVAGDDATHLRVANPLADDEPHLRGSLLESLAARAEYNLARMQGDVRLFEVGSAFARDGSGVSEAMQVGCLLMGRRRPAHFTEADPPAFDAWDAKGLAIALAGAAFPGRTVDCRAAESPTLWHVTVDGSVVGWVRRLALDAPVWASPAFGVELRLGQLSVAPVTAPGTHVHTAAVAAPARRAPIRYRALPTMPAANFDLAFVVPDAVEAGAVEAVLSRVAGELLEGIELFDEFRGKGVPDGHRSLAWRLTFRHPQRTLNEKELAGRRQKLIATVDQELGVSARTA
jgi:phenylalanyl-tRNA synthetase beta chain